MGARRAVCLFKGGFTFFTSLALEHDAYYERGLHIRGLGEGGYQVRQRNWRCTYLWKGECFWRNKELYGIDEVDKLA